MRIWLTAALLFGVLSGCSESDGGYEATDEQIARAEAVADELIETLGRHLFAELEKSGPAGAIEVCSEIAPRIARELSGDGVLVRRVTERPRNPDNRAGGWSARQLRVWEREIALGKTPKTYLAVAEETGPGGIGPQELWYLRPLLIAPPCLNCHGDPETMAPEVAERLSELYPGDQAVGYEVNDLRGAVFVRLGLEGQKQLPVLGPGEAAVRRQKTADEGDI